MIIAGHAVVRERPPCAGARIPHLGREHGAGVVEFQPRVAANHHHLAAWKDHRVCKLPCELHRGRRLHDRRCAVQIHRVGEFRARARGGIVRVRRRVCTTARDDDFTFVIHRPDALLRIMSAGDILPRCCERSAAVGIHPVHRARRAEVKELAARRDEHERMPDGDVASLARHRAPVDAREPLPAGRRVPTLRCV